MKPSWKQLFSAEILVGVGFLSIVGLLMVPLPPLVLDLMLALSIALSAVVFLTALFSEKPTDFSVFPVLLLISTLLRLALNIASTRLILLKGHEGQDAAGGIIAAFGHFVIGGNVAVGIIVFLALVIINFVVITKGAGRIAEVAARFTLDALPGKQMAIDAELNAGAINETEARARRAEVERQADFYGAMDGASKFVRGDAVAALIITAINLVGGIGMGVLGEGMDVPAALSTYSLLTVGDGLVSQMPALVVSTAAGLVISRATGRSDLGQDVATQLLGGGKVLAITAAFLLGVGLLPGLPLLPFAVLAAGLGLVARQRMAPPEEKKKEAQAPEAPPEPTMAEVLRVDTLSLEVGYGLLSLVDAARGGDVPERVKKLRRQLAQELGLVIPPVRVVDNLQLLPGAYVIKLVGLEVAKGELMADRLLAIDSSGAQSFPGGVATKEPVFGLPAFWIAPPEQSRAEAFGLTVVDPSTVLSTHLAEVLRKNAEQLLGRDQVHELVAYVAKEAPKLVEELVPTQLPLGELVNVLRGLLAERVSIRNLRGILEALASVVPRVKDARELAEVARAALWRQITAAVTDGDGKVHAIGLDGKTEHLLRASLSPGGYLDPEPAVRQGLIRQAAELAKRISEARNLPCILVSDELRRPLRELLQPYLPDVPVVAMRELDRGVELRLEGTISRLA